MRTEEKTSKKAKVDPEDRVFPVYGLSGEPVEEFVAVDGPKGTAARDNAQNKIALDAPRLLKTTEQRALNGDFAIENLATFQRKFQTLTAGTFTSFTAVDWANIVVAGSAEIKFRSFVAGGLIVACLQPGIPESALGRTFPNADVDVFLYGLDDAAGRRKLESLFNKLKSEAPTALAMRTPHTVTVVLPAPKRIVQIVLNLHTAAPDVIKAFDVDVCGVYYDGTAVFGSRRAARAFATNINIAVPERRSWTYEGRLIKYAKRGMEIAVPGLKTEEVQLKRRYEKKQSKRRLPTDHPEYDPNSYDHVVVGYDYRFGEDYWGWNDDDNVGLHDDLEATGCRKLLIADLAGREIFTNRGRHHRTKFIPNTTDTSVIADYIAETAEHYGPSLPDVGGAQKYKTSPNMTTFTRRANDQSRVTFVNGPIPTGTAAGFHDPTVWWNDCYIPIE